MSALPRGFIDCGLQTPKEDLQALYELARMAAEGRRAADVRFVEVGSWAGRTALTLLEGHPEGRVFCIDHWRGSAGDATWRLAEQHDVFDAFCKNAGPHLLKSIFPCVGTSRYWAMRWPFKVDLVFIDAGHEYEQVKEDIALWLPHVRPGGIICGHDYFAPPDGDFPGVKRAVDELGGCQGGGCCVWWKRVE